MAKYSGKIGFSNGTTETTPGVWTETVIEKPFKGEIVANKRRWEKAENLNDNITISNQISILCTTYIKQNVGNIRYVNWMGSNWKVDSFDINYPRLTVTLGGVYTGPTP